MSWDILTLVFLIYICFSSTFYKWLSTTMALRKWDFCQFLSHRLNISPLPNFPIFVKFCLRRPFILLRNLCHTLLLVKFCNSVKFCELTNLDLIGNFWQSWLLVQLQHKSKKKIFGLGPPGFIQFLGWDPILFTLFLFDAIFTLNLTNHTQIFPFLSNFTTAIFSPFSPTFRQFAHSTYSST